MLPRRLRRPSRRSASNVARSEMRRPTGALPPSRGEAVATFDPAGLEDRPAGPGGHTVAKPVVLRPSACIGLVSPLHSLVLCPRGRSWRGSSAGAPERTGARPEAWASMLGASPRPHQAEGPRPVPDRTRIHAEFLGARRRATVQVGAVRGASTRALPPLAGLDGPVYRSSRPVDHHGARHRT